MNKDPILEELWRIKDQLSACNGGDIRKLARELKEEEEKGGRNIVSLASRKIQAKPPTPR